MARTMAASGCAAVPTARWRTPVRIHAIHALPAALLLCVALPVSAAAWSYGSNTVQSPSEDGASNTGYGPGWMLLSYMPNCPGVGYLFSEGVLGKPSPDHFRINDTRDSSYGYGGNPVISRWPWGFGHGAYQACAFAYGTSKFEFVANASSLCPAAPVPPGDRCASSAFCTDQADPFCSPRGVWGQRDGEPNGKDGYSLGCQVFANIGHSGVFGDVPNPTHALGSVPPGALLDVRYVTRNRQYAWAKWTGHAFVNGTVWAFFPRSCISLTAPAVCICGDDGNPCTVDHCVANQCRHDPVNGSCPDDGNACTDDACRDGQCAHPFAARCLAPILAILESDECGDNVVDDCARGAVPVAGAKLLMRDSADTRRRSIALQLVDPRIGEAIVDPAAAGATLQIFNSGTGEAVCLALPNAGGAWRQVGAGGWRYRDAAALSGPCKVAVLKGDRLTLKCNGKRQPIQYSLDEASQGSVGVRFTVGNLTYCAEFGGTVKSDSGTGPPIAAGRGTFHASHAPAPSRCTASPSPCP